MFFHLVLRFCLRGSSSKTLYFSATVFTGMRSEDCLMLHWIVQLVFFYLLEHQPQKMVKNTHKIRRLLSV